MGQAIADGVPGGRAQVLPALRHLSLVEDPALAGLAADFLSGAETGAEAGTGTGSTTGARA